ncbi:hypothetical protein PoB_000388000 [Plakobranchus ocellatus]|uniref:Uncharacterized protein n=1 Tax=Plakobranchus ocellatus TaxID=259542 RepID=A0AAV3Y2U6_9GAST|nr:hypothetical protein PoB_000388000 [Plakobranchus ocellatus]
MRLHQRPPRAGLASVSSAPPVACRLQQMRSASQSHKMISSFQALRKARAPVARLATEGSLPVDLRMDSLATEPPRPIP